MHVESHQAAWRAVWGLWDRFNLSPPLCVPVSWLLAESSMLAAERGCSVTAGFLAQFEATDWPAPFTAAPVPFPPLAVLTPAFFVAGASYLLAPQASACCACYGHAAHAVCPAAALGAQQLRLLLAGVPLLPE